MFSIDLKPLEVLMERLVKAFEERNVLLREQNDMTRNQLKAALDVLAEPDEEEKAEVTK